MKKTKNLLLTFDYELSLGYRSGSVDNCMIKPTNLILDLLQKFNLKAIFFVDTTSIMAMEKHSKNHVELNNDIEKIKNQVVKMHKAGHYVYHHIHPHWVDAKYIESEKQWDLSDMTNYALNNFSENQIDDFFKKSKEILESWIHPIDKSYSPEGYRAGGLFVQPFNKLKKAFIKYGIKYDFSVMFKAECDIDVAKYNFIKHPSKTIYSFEDDVLQTDKNGPFKEVAIEMLENKGLYKILNSLWFRLFKQEKPFADGKSIVNKINLTSKKINFSNKETFSFELINPAKNLLYYKILKEKDFIHFLSHPKHVSNSNIKYAYKFFEKIIKNYNINSDFKKILN